MEIKICARQHHILVLVVLGIPVLTSMHNI